jgi:hypothetical protein
MKWDAMTLTSVAPSDKRQNRAIKPSKGEHQKNIPSKAFPDPPPEYAVQIG